MKGTIWNQINAIWRLVKDMNMNFWDRLSAISVTLFAIGCSILQGIWGMVPILLAMFTLEMYLAIRAYYIQQVKQAFRHKKT